MVNSEFSNNFHEVIYKTLYVGHTLPTQAYVEVNLSLRGTIFDFRDPLYGQGKNIDLYLKKNITKINGI